MDKRKAKREAVAKFLASFVITPLHSEVYFSEGYEAGFKAVSWIHIKTVDDLPKTSGLYLWFSQRLNMPVLQSFSPLQDNLAGYVEFYSAWMPIPPDTES